MEPGTTYVQKLPSGKVGFVRRPIKIKPTKSILADAFLPNRDGPAWTPPYTCNLDPPPTDTIDLKDTNRPLPLTDGPSQSYHHCRECQLAARKYDPNHTVRHTLGFMLLQRQRQDIGVPYVDGIARLHTNIDIRSYQAGYLPLVCVASQPQQAPISPPTPPLPPAVTRIESSPNIFHFCPNPPGLFLTVALPRAAIIYLIIRRQAVLAACIVIITTVAIVNPGLTLFGGQGALMSLRLFHQRAPEDQLSTRIYRLLDKLIDLTLKILTRGQGLQMRIGLTATNA
ncbi:hypothetical protein McanCB56680_000288 [Microsporum canis]